MYQPVDPGQTSAPAEGTPHDLPASRRRAVTRASAAIVAASVLAVGTLLLGTAKAPSATANATTAEFVPTERHAKVARLVSSPATLAQATPRTPIESIERMITRLTSKRCASDRT